MIRLAVRVARSHAEPVLAELLVLAPGGLEERDVDADTVEYALYGAPGELPDVGELRAAAGGALVDVSTSEVADGSNWRDWHRPLDVGPLRVRPPWEPERPGALDVVIDPGQAFGTGAHPSTRLTLELLVSSPAEAARRLGLRLGHPVGRRRASSARSGAGLRPRAGLGGGDAAAAAANGVEVTASRCDLRAARPARGRRPSWPTSCGRCCSRSRRASTAPRAADRLRARDGEVEEVAAAFEPACRSRRAARATAGPPSC